MAYALVSHVGSVLGINGGTSGNIDTTGASLLVAAFSCEVNHNIACTDNKSNTWFPLTLLGTAQQYCQIWYCWGTDLTVGSGHNVSSGTVTGGAVAVAFAAFSGYSGTKTGIDPLGEHSWFFGSSGSTLLNVGFTPTSANQIVITGCSINLNASTLSVNGGFTITDFVNFGTGVNYGVGLAYLVQTTAANAQPQWSRTGTTTASFSTMLASFRNNSTAGSAETSHVSFGV